MNSTYQWFVEGGIIVKGNGTEHIAVDWGDIEGEYKVSFVETTLKGCSDTVSALVWVMRGGFVPGIKPGRKTGEFIDGVISHITLPGSIFLAIVAIMPSIAVMLGINSQFAQFYGGTSLLILVGVVLDTLQQIESHLLMRHYDGLMQSGRIKGRSTVGAA